MRILFLSSWYPYPPDTGGKLRIFNLVRCLSQNHEVTFLSFSRSGRVTADRIEAMWQFGEVLEPAVLPATSSAVIRTLKNPRWHSEEMRSRIREATRSRSFDVIVAAEVLAGFYGAEIPGIPRILDNSELTVFIERCAREPHLLKRLPHQLDWYKRKHFTGSLARRYDICTAVSEHEQRHLQALVPEPERIVVVPNGVDVAGHQIASGPHDPYRLVYAGALTYHANLDAMEFFVHQIFPGIRSQHPQATIHITGDNRGVDAQHLLRGNPPGVVLTGHLRDIRPYVAESAICVVPLRIGGGTRLKILEAMALGTPVVSTTKGAEGLNLRDGQHILIADDPASFARAVGRLFDDERLRKALTSEARTLVEKFYDWSVCVRRLEEWIERLGNRSIS